MRSVFQIGPVMSGRRDLPPRLFTQEINPFKQAFFIAGASRRADQDRADYFYQEKSGRSLAGVCMGHYWDAVNKRSVTVNLGVVTLKTLVTFRPASSVAARFFAADNLSRGEGAAHNAVFFDGAERPQRGTREDVPQAVENSSGSYVIPGQSLMEETKAERTVK